MRLSLPLFIAATGSITTGVWWLSPAAALIVLGVILALVGVLLLDDRRKS